MYTSIKDSVRYLKGVGPRRAKLLENLGINTIEDLLYYFPRRYEDRSRVSKISSLKAGEFQVIKAKILGSGQRFSLRKKSFNIFEAVVDDKSARLACVWFNQPYLKNYLKPNVEIVLYGRPIFYEGRLQMQNPEFELAGGTGRENLFYGRIIGVYPLTESLSQRQFRRIMDTSIKGYIRSLEDILPFSIRQRHSLLNIAEAILNMHFPGDAATQETAYKRIVFEECLLLSLLFGLRRQRIHAVSGIAHTPDDRLLEVFLNSLPFELTCAQKKVMQEIKSDMLSLVPMHRLLQGDVGSGKTVVAVYACLIAASGNYQSAFMAPTEILAQQHYANIAQHLAGIPDCRIKIALLTGSINKKQREKICLEIKNGAIDIAIGTHALIQQGVDFKNLGLAVIDEQHKFGVNQRIDMLTKGRNPDCLIMTATPIPRTLAMTIYSDMDISTIDQMPKGRLPIKTYVVSAQKRAWVYNFIKENIQQKKQAYIVYPIIDESESLDLKAASIMYEDLRQGAFKGFKVGLIHGKVKQEERNLIMREFKNGTIDVLVSTIVIEVGVDVPNAAVMVIEHAERFGLAQLHQLRGRIGRGSLASYCILIADDPGREASLRLEAIAQEADGFVIAEKDLEIRGPGEFFGERQHGIPELRVNPFNNLQLINLSREESRGILSRDPNLNDRANIGLKNTLKKRFPDYEKYLPAS